MKGFEIVSPSQYFDKLTRHAKKGATRGVYLGFPNIHENYTMSLPGVTDWTGFPQSGKTQVLMEFLMNTSVFYDWKHMVYFPDVGNEVEILSDLIHKYTGKTFDKRYQNHITEAEISKALPWVTEHFKIVTKKDLKAKLTPYKLWDWAADIKAKEGLETCCIDAWKDMRHDTSEFGRDDKYLEDVLSYRNAMAEKHNLHFHTVIHPLKTEKDSQGRRKPPGPYDMKGGTEWYNNAKSSVTVHRPDGEDNVVQIFWNKIKPRSIGQVGMSELYFDISKFRYYIKDQGNEKYAQEVPYKLQQQSDSEQISLLGNEDDDIPF